MSEEKEVSTVILTTVSMTATGLRLRGQNSHPQSGQESLNKNGQWAGQPAEKQRGRQSTVRIEVKTAVWPTSRKVDGRHRTLP